MHRKKIEGHWISFICGGTPLGCYSMEILIDDVCISEIKPFLCHSLLIQIFLIIGMYFGYFLWVLNLQINCTLKLYPLDNITMIYQLSILKM